MCLQYYRGQLRPEESMRDPETRVVDGFELPFGSQQLNPGPLGERPVLEPTEASLQIPCLLFFNLMF